MSFSCFETQINSAHGHINVAMLTIYSSFPPALGPCWIKKSLASHAVACIVPFILFRSEFRLDVYVRCPQLLCRWNGNGMKNENGIKYLLTRMNNSNDRS